MYSPAIVTPSEAVIFSVELNSDGAPLGISLTGIYIHYIYGHALYIYTWHMVCVADSMRHLFVYAQ